MSDTEARNSQDQEKRPNRIEVGGDVVHGDQVNIRGNQINYNVAGNLIISQGEALSPAEKRNRQLLLKIVKQTWIDGFLTQNLPQSISIEPEINFQHEAIERPWAFTLLPENKSLSSTVEIENVFEENGRSLLILGEPGSGKTVTLLQLANALIERAVQNEAEPIPIILNLSSWTPKTPFLTSWLTDEMFTVYGVARQTAQHWIKGGQLILLLDGLDENRNPEACLDAINQFKEQVGLDLVVCSRSEDYGQLKNKLNLTGAIEIQPLNRQKIDTFLSRFGDRLAGLRNLIKEKETWFELAQSPLMLGLMPMTYADLPANQIQQEQTVDAQRSRLLANYVSRVFERRPPQADHDRQEQAVAWLAFLAANMQREGQSVFYLERLNLSWLKEKVRARYQWWLGTLHGLLLGIIMGPLFVLGEWLVFYESGQDLGYGFHQTVWDLLLFGLAIVLVAGLSGALSLWLSSFMHKKRRRLVWGPIVNASIFGFVIGPIFLKLGIMRNDPIFAYEHWPLMVSFWQGVGVVFGFGLMISAGMALNSDKAPIRDQIIVKRPSWRSVGKNLAWGSGLGLTIGLIFSIIVGFINGLTSLFDSSFLAEVLARSLDSFLSSGIFFGGWGVLGGLGWSFIHAREVEVRNFPGQGIRSSLQTSFIITSLLTIFLFSLLIASWATPSAEWFIGQFLFFLTILIPPVLTWFGGLAWAQHYALRLTLNQQGDLPVFLDPWLKAMIDRGLLRQVGSGYIFIHRYLLDYFADQQHP